MCQPVTFFPKLWHRGTPSRASMGFKSLLAAGVAGRARGLRGGPGHETRWERNMGILINGDGSKPWYLVNPKIAGKWMFIPLKMVLICIDPYPNEYNEYCSTKGLSDCPL